MSIYFILAAMIFLHIIDDYVLQAPCLCDLKQKSFWEKNAPAKLYENDYAIVSDLVRPKHQPIEDLLLRP